jgi:hypothetical protein
MGKAVLMGNFIAISTYNKKGNISNKQPNGAS